MFPEIAWSDTSCTRMAQKGTASVSGARSSGFFHPHGRRFRIKSTAELVEHFPMVDVSCAPRSRAPSGRRVPDCEDRG
jgi:hypothetical protein